ncbi:ABC transporter ATP-binding protein [Kordia algicida OT-1]|uniref:Multiple sugar-binding ABC transporter, ATP-binding protein n=1 Tax=Kordia algicida OT-1 TaxID=391587 RepID=A9DR33_9FLAO|nr:ABC transporter ATP-binding protein [Kordia algicida]EDP96734.1 multiple sugar-binding ABC transporter, ATP-binding protein [Kordia algicida OT-1]
MLKVQNVSFSYLENTPILKDISFKIPQGTHVSIIGESGCGKSTLLKLLYGLYDLNEGEIFWNDEQILGPAFHLVPGFERMKYVAQDFDLMPYTTVAENIGTYLSNFYPEEKQQRIHELLEMVEMTAFADVKAKLLSGGQQQRVALAKALAREPEVLLLDEPFSHIDNFRKNALRRNLFSYLKKENITCIVATHDRTDALSFADSTIVLQHGKLIAQNDSKDLFQNPPNKYIASLFGEVNELPARLFPEINASTETILVYPHQLKISDTSDFKVTVQQSYFKGSHYLVLAKYERKLVFFESLEGLEVGVLVGLKIL